MIDRFSGLLWQVGKAAALTVGMLLTPQVSLAQATLAPYPAATRDVACSDVEMDYSKLPAGATAESAWRGVGAFVTDILVGPASLYFAGDPLARLEPVYQASIPNNSSIFKRYAGESLAYAALVCYPTTSDNTRPDFPLPNGQFVPRMQRGDQFPIISSEKQRWPMLLMSHGLGGAPLDADYLAVTKRFAAEGYIVVAPFHGDQRFGPIKINDFGTALDLVRNYPLVAELMAVRAVSVSATLDHFLNYSPFSHRIDTTAIAGWGASLGGQALMLNQGAKLTTSISGGDGEVVVRDKRIKAFVGYVPYSGLEYSLLTLTTFGDGNRGVRGIRTPYMAIGGTRDTTAPISQTARAVNNLSGPRYLVSINGLEHTFIPSHAPDIFTWSLLFYRAHLFGDASARATLAQAQSIVGSADDSMVTSVTLPWWYQDEAEVVEYYHSGINHYFQTGFDEEKAMLDTNRAMGWVRTGERFAAWKDSSTYAQQVFRFYHDAKGNGVNTHFFTLDAPEAAGLRLQPNDWLEEGSGWRALPFGTSCSSNFITLTRAYNNRFAFRDSNHRFMVNAALPNTMRNQGWIVEGPVMCVLETN